LAVLVLVKGMKSLTGSAEASRGGLAHPFF